MRSNILGTELPDLAETCPVRCDVEQPAMYRVL